jgi:hypothetical protein
VVGYFATDQWYILSTKQGNVNMGLDRVRLVTRKPLTAILLAWMVLGGLCGCDSVDLQDGGSYIYTAWSQGGEVVVSGTFDLIFGERTEADGTITISGDWQLQRVGGGGREVGPQVGEGEMRGTIDNDGNLSINLNPDWADNNVFLSGHFSDERFGDFEGMWSYATFAGHTAGGTFRAERD